MLIKVNIMEQTNESIVNPSLRVAVVDVQPQPMRLNVLNTINTELCDIINEETPSGEQILNNLTIINFINNMNYSTFNGILSNRL